MTVDFHVHSAASDGTCTPSELVEKAAGFAVMALTDHDNMDGAEEFLSARNVGEAVSPVRVAGIELSIEPGDGFDKFHLLGLGVDPQNAELKAFLRQVLKERDNRNVRIIENFRRRGIEMAEVATASQSSNLQTLKPSNPQAIFSYAHGEVLARPHFARWLVDRGYATDVKDAFNKYLLPDSPKATRCYEERWHPLQEDAFRVIHQAGGLCVMAHPRYWKNEWKTSGCDFAAAERGLAALKEKGLDGVEALYQANTNEENIEFVRLATRLDYLKSAGSDFHGLNKPTIPLGMDVSEDYIRPLLERLGI